MNYLDNFLTDEKFLNKVSENFWIWMSCEPSNKFPLGLL